MKRIIAIVMALVMMMAVTVPAFAADPITHESTNKTGTVNVTTKFDENNDKAALSLTKLPEKTVVLRFNGREDTQKQIISGKAFYKDLGKGFGAVAEYTGKYCALYIIRGLGEWSLWQPEHWNLKTAL